MRTSDRITLIKHGKQTYNPETGRHDKLSESRVTFPCHLSDLGMDRSQEVFGDYRKDIKVARLLHENKDVYDSAEIDDEPYTIKARRLNGRVFYLERDSNGSRL